MLIRLTAEQVNKQWDELKPRLKSALPSHIASSENAVTNLLTQLLAQQASIWAYYKQADDQDEKRMHGFVVTATFRDPFFKYKRLHILTFYANEYIERGDIVEALETLRDYAGSQDCQDIFFGSDNQVLGRVLESMGWDTSHDLVTIST